jgi:hypothetical protein
MHIATLLDRNRRHIIRALTGADDQGIGRTRCDTRRQSAVDLIEPHEPGRPTRVGDRTIDAALPLEWSTWSALPNVWANDELVQSF